MEEKTELTVTMKIKGNLTIDNINDWISTLASDMGFYGVEDFFWITEDA